MSLRFLSAASLSIACLCFAFPASALPVDAGACGHVSTEAGNVPTSLGVFTAQITQIDGRPPPMQRYEYRLAAGKHVLVVGERIDRARLNSAQAAQIRKMQSNSPAYLKALILDVQPGTSYRLGTRLIHDKLDTQSIRDNAYWEPVVWDEVAQACP
ncbi:MAG: hypothetical protein EOP92_29545 [Lysobacteraceae bacterium]|nr:MAG: hypothetical protein EOP92_29545 [Xanthomonadaceae bacterium]